MTYEAPVLLAVGPASKLILGGAPDGAMDRMPETDFRKRGDIEEGLDA